VQWLSKVHAQAIDFYKLDLRPRSMRRIVKVSLQDGVETTDYRQAGVVVAHVSCFGILHASGHFLRFRTFFSLIARAQPL
jgi:hypothetical protein